MLMYMCMEGTVGFVCVCFSVFHHFISLFFFFLLTVYSACFHSVGFCQAVLSPPLYKSLSFLYCFTFKYLFLMSLKRKHRDLRVNFKCLRK